MDTSSLQRLWTTSVDSSRSLPPGVSGQVIGLLQLSLDAVQLFTLEAGQQAKVQVRFRWWGQDEYGAATAVGSLTEYHIRCSQRQFAKYLEDAQILEAVVEIGGPVAPVYIGNCALDLRSLTVASYLQRDADISTDQGALGKLYAHLHVQLPATLADGVVEEKHIGLFGAMLSAMGSEGQGSQAVNVVTTLSRWWGGMLSPQEQDYALMMLGNVPPGATADLDMLADACAECSAAEVEAGRILKSSSDVPDELRRFAGCILSSLPHSRSTVMPLKSVAQFIMDCVPEATMQELRTLLALLSLRHGNTLALASLAEDCQILISQEGKPELLQPTPPPSAAHVAAAVQTEPSELQAMQSKTSNDIMSPQPRAALPKPLQDLRGVSSDLQNETFESHVIGTLGSGKSANQTAAVETWSWLPHWAQMPAEAANEQQVALGAPAANGQPLDFRPYGITLSHLQAAGIDALLGTSLSRTAHDIASSQPGFVAHAPVGLPVITADRTAPPQQAVGYPAFIGQDMPADMQLLYRTAPHVDQAGSPVQLQTRSADGLLPQTREHSAAVGEPGVRQPVPSQDRESAGSRRGFRSADLAEYRSAWRRCSGSGDAALEALIARAAELHKDMDRVLQVHGQLRAERAVVGAAVTSKREAACSPLSRSARSSHGEHSSNDKENGDTAPLIVPFMRPHGACDGDAAVWPSANGFVQAPAPCDQGTLQEQDSRASFRIADSSCASAIRSLDDMRSIGQNSSNAVPCAGQASTEKQRATEEFTESIVTSSSTHSDLLCPAGSTEQSQQKRESLALAKELLTTVLQPPGSSFAKQDDNPACSHSNSTASTANLQEALKGASESLSGLQDEGGTNTGRSAPLGVPGGPDIVHILSLNILAVEGLQPVDSFADATAGQQRCWLVYRFPGNVKALQTPPAAWSQRLVFSVSVQHEVILPAGTKLGSSAAPGSLEFQVWQRAASGPDMPSARGAIVLADIGNLAFPDQAVRPNDGTEVAYTCSLPLQQLWITSGPNSKGEAWLQLELQYSVREAATEARAEAASQPEKDSAGQAGVAGAAAERHSIRLRVCVLRACGLQAAVEQAMSWLGKGSALLGRAKQRGPNSSVQITWPETLGADTSAARSAVVHSSHTPSFGFELACTVHVSEDTVAALCSEEVNIEVWHRCPRSQIVASALAAGLRSTQQSQDIFLGRATLPLDRLLVSQGFATFLPLQSRSGSIVGLLEIDMQAFQDEACCKPSRPLLDMFPNAAKSLPEELQPMACGHGTLPAGFDGQLAEFSIEISECLLSPPEYYCHATNIESSLHSIIYRLPGCQDSLETAACLPTSRGSIAGRSTSYSLVGKQAKTFSVCADALLAQALLGNVQLLVVRHGSLQSEQMHQRRHHEIVGTAHLKLAGLLSRRLVSRTVREVNASLPLFCPAAKTLGDAHLDVKVSLNLRPTQAALIPSSPPRWQLQEHQPACHQSSQSPVCLVPDQQASDLCDQQGTAEPAMPDSAAACTARSSSHSNSGSQGVDTFVQANHLLDVAPSNQPTHSAPEAETAANTDPVIDESIHSACAGDAQAKVTLCIESAVNLKGSLVYQREDTSDMAGQPSLPKLGLYVSAEIADAGGEPWQCSTQLVEPIAAPDPEYLSAHWHCKRTLPTDSGSRVCLKLWVKQLDRDGGELQPRLIMLGLAVVDLGLLHGAGERDISCNVLDTQQDRIGQLQVSIAANDWRQVDFFEEEIDLQHTLDTSLQGLDDDLLSGVGAHLGGEIFDTNASPWVPNEILQAELPEPGEEILNALVHSPSTGVAVADSIMDEDVVAELLKGYTGPAGLESSAEQQSSSPPPSLAAEPTVQTIADRLSTSSAARKNESCTGSPEARQEESLHPESAKPADSQPPEVQQPSNSQANLTTNPGTFEADDALRILGGGERLPVADSLVISSPLAGQYPVQVDSIGLQGSDSLASLLSDLHLQATEESSRLPAFESISFSSLLDERGRDGTSFFDADFELGIPNFPGEMSAADNASSSGDWEAQQSTDLPGGVDMSPPEERLATPRITTCSDDEDCLVFCTDPAGVSTTSNSSGASSPRAAEEASAVNPDAFRPPSAGGLYPGGSWDTDWLFSFAKRPVGDAALAEATDSPVKETGKAIPAELESPRSPEQDAADPAFAEEPDRLEGAQPRGKVGKLELLDLLSAGSQLSGQRDEEANNSVPLHPLLAASPRPRSAPPMGRLVSMGHVPPELDSPAAEIPSSADREHPLLSFDPFAQQPLVDIPPPVSDETQLWGFRTVAPPEFAAELDFPLSPPTRGLRMARGRYSRLPGSIGHRFASAMSRSVGELTTLVEEPHEETPPEEGIAIHGSPARQNAMEQSSPALQCAQKEHGFAATSIAEKWQGDHVGGADMQGRSSRLHKRSTSWPLPHAVYPRFGEPIIRGREISLPMTSPFDFTLGSSESKWDNALLWPLHVVPETFQASSGGSSRRVSASSSELLRLSGRFSRSSPRLDQYTISNDASTMAMDIKLRKHVVLMPPLPAVQEASPADAARTASAPGNLDSKPESAASQTESADRTKGRPHSGSRAAEVQAVDELSLPEISTDTASGRAHSSTAEAEKPLEVQERSAQARAAPQGHRADQLSSAQGVERQQVAEDSPFLQMHETNLGAALPDARDETCQGKLMHLYQPSSSKSAESLPHGSAAPSADFDCQATQSAERGRVYALDEAQPVLAALAGHPARCVPQSSGIDVHLQPFGSLVRAASLDLPPKKHDAVTQTEADVACTSRQLEQQQSTGQGISAKGCEDSAFDPEWMLPGRQQPPPATVHEVERPLGKPIGECKGFGQEQSAASSVSQVGSAVHPELADQRPATSAQFSSTWHPSKQVEMQARTSSPPDEAAAARLANIQQSAPRLSADYSEIGMSSGLGVAGMPDTLPPPGVWHTTATFSTARQGANAEGSPRGERQPPWETQYQQAAVDLEYSSRHPSSGGRSSSEKLIGRSDSECDANIAAARDCYPASGTVREPHWMPMPFPDPELKSAQAHTGGGQVHRATLRGIPRTHYQNAEGILQSSVLDAASSQWLQCPTSRASVSNPHHVYSEQLAAFERPRRPPPRRRPFD